MAVSDKCKFKGIVYPSPTLSSLPHDLENCGKTNLPSGSRIQGLPPKDSRTEL